MNIVFVSSLPRRIYQLVRPSKSLQQIPQTNWLPHRIRKALMEADPNPAMLVSIFFIPSRSLSFSLRFALESCSFRDG